MPTYAAGATVERRYPGPGADAARTAAEPQVQAFLSAGWMIGGERWEGDRQQGAPIGDAIATGSVSYLAGSGGELVITYVADRDTDLPAAVPAYTLTNPRADNLQTLATARVVSGIVAVVIFAIIFLGIAGQMGRMTAGFRRAAPVLRRAGAPDLHPVGRPRRRAVSSSGDDRGQARRDPVLRVAARPFRHPPP